METSHLRNHKGIERLIPRPKIHICGFLTVKETCRVVRVNKSWKEAGNHSPFWENLAVQQLGKNLAEIFFNKCRGAENRWKKVVTELHSPFRLKSNSLRTLFSLYAIEGLRQDETEPLRLVESAIISKNIVQLNELLSDLQQTASTYLLEVPYHSRNGDLLFNGIVTTLKISVIIGDVKITELLIRAGAKDWLQKDRVEQSCLFLAAVSQNPPMVQLLLEHGTEVDLGLENLLDDRGFPLPPSPTIIRLLIESKLDESELVESFLLMMKAWIAFNRNKSFASAAKNIFNDAIILGRLHFAKILLILGVKPEIDKNLIKDLIWAANLEAIKFIHENNLFDLKNFREEDGATLIFFQSSINSRVINFLIEIGIPLDIKDKEGRDYGQFYNNKILKGFLNFELGYENLPKNLVASFDKSVTDVNAPLSESGDRALHYAIRDLIHNIAGIKNYIDMLLKKGADPKLANKNGETPYSQLKDFLWKNEDQLRQGRPEFFKLLKATLDQLAFAKK